MNLNIKKDQMEMLINNYNTNPDNQELEFLYKAPISEDILSRILKFVS